MKQSIVHTFRRPYMDEDDFSEDIARIYQVATSPLLWNELAAILAKRIGCTSIQLLSGNQETGEVYNAYSSILAEKDVQFYQTNIFHNDQLVAITKACTAGLVHHDRMLLSDYEKRSAQSYQEFYQHHGMYHWMFTDIKRNEKERMFIAFARDENDCAFAQKEISYFQRLVPHLKNAQSLNEQFRNAQSNQQNIFEYFNRIDSPVIAVSHTLKILNINASAEQLYRNKEFNIKHNHLLLNNQSSQHTLLQLLYLSENEKNQITQPWIYYHQYKIQVLFLHCNIDGNILTGNRIAILIFENIETTEQRVERLSLFYSLTETELYVLQLLMENLKITDIAEALIISIETVRFHLKNIFSKTGTHSQKELILLFLND